MPSVIAAGGLVALLGFNVLVYAAAFSVAARWQRLPRASLGTRILAVLLAAGTHFVFGTLLGLGMVVPPLIAAAVLFAAITSSFRVRWQQAVASSLACAAVACVLNLLLVSLAMMWAGPL